MLFAITSVTVCRVENNLSIDVNRQVKWVSLNRRRKSGVCKSDLFIPVQMDNFRYLPTLRVDDFLLRVKIEVNMYHLSADFDKTQIFDKLGTAWKCKHN